MYCSVVIVIIMTTDHSETKVFVQCKVCNDLLLFVYLSITLFAKIDVLKHIKYYYCLKMNRYN